MPPRTRRGRRWSRWQGSSITEAGAKRTRRVCPSSVPGYETAWAHRGPRMAICRASGASSVQKRPASPRMRSVRRRSSGRVGHRERASSISSACRAAPRRGSRFVPESHLRAYQCAVAIGFAPRLRSGIEAPCSASGQEAAPFANTSFPPASSGMMNCSASGEAAIVRKEGPVRSR